MGHGQLRPPEAWAVVLGDAGRPAGLRTRHPGVAARPAGRRSAAGRLTLPGEPLPGGERVPGIDACPAG